jgi:hypothetical protein
MTIVDEFRENESRVLDRLVDGELSQADRRELLVALEDEPGAWRRCALTFLEAQTWRWQLGRMAAGPLVAQAAVPSRPPAAPWRGANRATLWGACLATAAGLLVAFALGTRFPTTGAVPLATGAGGEPAASAGASLPAEGSASPPPARSLAGEATANQADQVPAASETAGNPPATSPWATLTLTAADTASPNPDDPDKQFKVRVRDAESASSDLEQLLASGRSNLPTALVHQLEREGWQVSRQRHLLPVDLSDGRRMVVPIEQVDLRRPEVEQY